MERYKCITGDDSLEEDDDGPYALYADAQATVEALQKKYDDLLGKYHQLMDFYDKHNGTPCEQIRHEQQVEALQRERDGAVKRSSSYLVDKNAIQKELQRERGFTNRYLKRLHEAEAALDAERTRNTQLKALVRAYGQFGEILQREATYRHWDEKDGRYTLAKVLKWWREMREGNTNDSPGQMPAV